LDLSCDDHDISVDAPVFGARRAFELGLVVSVEASTLSWLQSSSRSLISGSSAASAVSASIAELSGFSVFSLSVAGTACAFAGIEARLKPAASISSTVRPYPVLEIIALPAYPGTKMRAYRRKIVAGLSGRAGNGASAPCPSLAMTISGQDAILGR